MGIVCSIAFLVITAGLELAMDLRYFSFIGSSVKSDAGFPYKWFIYVFMINILLLCAILYYIDYFENATVGHPGLKGYPGATGRSSPDCVLSDCVAGHAVGSLNKVAL